MHFSTTIWIAVLSLCIHMNASYAASNLPATSNIELIGQTDLKGAGKGGEGLALKQYGNRKILFLAHESGPQCFSVVDVSNPKKPNVISQLPVEDTFVRCNSLALHGDTLVVARQTAKVNQPYGGITFYDIKQPENPRLISYMDLTGPHSRGTHYLTIYDNYAYLATGAKDFVPKNPLDDQMLMIVDISNPTQAREINRWWLPGTRVGDTEASPIRVADYDSGFRMHTLLMPEGRPDRAYIGWIDGGIVVLDISDKRALKEVAHVYGQTLNESFIHTVLPIPERNILIASQEATKNNCEDWPKRILVLDNQNESRPYPLSVMPPSADFKALCSTGGRYGAHNINQNTMPTMSRALKNTIVTAQFSGGIRIFSITDPWQPKEIAYFAPPVVGNNGKAIQMNDLIVGNDGLIYANDRFTGGLYILKYTGKVPLN